MNMLDRRQDLPLHKSETCFLWGPRQTGKSTLLKNMFPDAVWYDLLLADVFRRLLSNPSLIREECEARSLDSTSQSHPVIIDEVQKIPEIMDEIHWLIENKGLRFILSGSSPRKLVRSRANLLGGRGIRYELFPLTFREIPDFRLDKALNNGLLPRHYLHNSPSRLIQSYINDYLQDEILAEAATRNLPTFNRFLEIAALSNGEMVNYSNVARECGVSSPTAREYFQILEDTLLGRYVPAYRRRKKRRLIRAPKFYFFDVGLVGALTRRSVVVPGSELFGKAFEHFIFMELAAHSYYSDFFYPISYWRTASRIEVDFILGDMDVALEVKSTNMIQRHHLRAMRALREEHPTRCIVVSLDKEPRRTRDGIDIIPWKLFLERLWSGEIIN